MKNILIIYFSITFLFLSCNTNRKILSNCSEYKILDSIAYVDFPDIYSTQGGNNVFNKILSYKNDINLCLIEKIKDTALSNYKYADSFYFLNGDIAFFMLTYNNPTDDLIINELFFKEFKKYYWDKKVGYIYKNKEAINHLFSVGTGLDSQILGDFEVISQLKKSFSLAKKYNLINAFMDRLLNCVIQASKRIKNETELSSGATSVSFASVQYILQNVVDISQKNILLFGTGKIGRNTCENLIKHTQNEHITLINRTKEKAQEIAGRFNVLVKDFGLLKEELIQTDVLVVATGSKTPTITKEMLPSDKEMLILDLSIPKNVATDVEELSKVRLIHMDYLSQMTDDTLERRKAFIPQAQQIIEEINANNFLKDKKIRVHIGEQIFEGTAKNIAEDGRLEIEMNGEIKLFSVGEITIEKDYY